MNNSTTAAPIPALFMFDNSSLMSHQPAHSIHMVATCRSRRAEADVNMPDPKQDHRNEPFSIAGMLRSRHLHHAHLHLDGKQNVEVGEEFAGTDIQGDLCRKFSDVLGLRCSKTRL
jgi:hypothetical protein